MRISYRRSVGWRGESYRHYLSAKGISSGHKRYYAETMLGEMLYGASARMGAGAAGTVERYQDISAARRQKLAAAAVPVEAARAELARERIGPLTFDERKLRDAAFKRALEAAPSNLKSQYRALYSDLRKNRAKIDAIIEREEDLKEQKAEFEKSQVLGPDTRKLQSIANLRVNINRKKSEVGKLSGEERELEQIEVAEMEEQLGSKIKANEEYERIRVDLVKAAREDKKRAFENYYDIVMRNLAESKSRLQVREQTINRELGKIISGEVGAGMVKAQYEGIYEGMGG